MLTPRSRRLAVLILSLLLGGAALAQVDPRAQELLDGVAESFAHLGDTFSGPLETMDLTLCFTFYEAGEAQPEMCTRMVMDRVGERLMQETHTTFQDEEGSEEHVTKAVYKDGQLSMRDSFSEEPFELPASEVAALEAIFESVFDQLTNLETMLPEEIEKATYDGEVNYGDVLVGEQVTATVFVPTLMTGGATVQETTGRFIFGAEGRFIGSIYETPEGDLMMVFEDPGEGAPFFPMLNHTLYRLEGEEVMIEGRTRVSHFAFNEPLDDALFELEEGR